MQHTIIPIHLLDGHSRNFRSHPEPQLKKLEASLTRFQQVRSIVVKAQPGGRYTILAGHGVTEAARRCGIQELSCDIVPDEWTETDASGYLAADNMGGYEDDLTTLAELLQEQANAGYTLESLGSSEEELEALLAELAAEALGEEPKIGAGGDEFDTTPAEGPTRSQYGDLWQLGENHRLLVGDSTNPSDVARLMNGQKAALVVTSPPYWVGREYEQEHGQEEIRKHIDNAALAMASVMAESSHIALNTGTTTETKQGGQIRKIWLLLDWWAAAFDRCGWYLRNIRIWAKEGGFSSFSPAQDLVGQDWEFLASFTHAKPKHQNQIGERWALDGVWNCQPQTVSVGHSAPFPIEIPWRYIQLYTDEGDVVYEPYAGSGTTMIACERSARTARLCEREPRYADVCLARYEAESGEAAVLLERTAKEEVPA